MYICVQVVPGSKKEMIEILGVNSYGQTIYKIKTNAPAVDGKANSAIRTALASYLNKKPSNVVLVKGHLSREKLFYIT